jgi:hypothetical protein
MGARFAPGQMFGNRNKVFFGFVAFITAGHVTCAAAAIGVSPADIYWHLLDRYCPDKHLRWLNDADLALAIDNFRDALEPAPRGQMDAVADVKTRCSGSLGTSFIGITCQNNYYLVGVSVIDRLPQLAMNVCSMPVACLSMGNCSEQR